MTFRICTYNVKDFDKLFTASNALANGELRKGVTKAQARQALKEVLTAVDADVVGIVEAPNTTTNGPADTVVRLEAFASDAGLRTTKAVTGFISAGKQELALLFDPDKVEVKHEPGGSDSVLSNPPFNGELRFDTDDDRVKELYKFYRPPLETKITLKASGREIFTILAHPKSKGIFSSMDVVHWDRENRRNRRKLIAECSWIRKRVDEWLSASREVIVMGDMNDGPGMDFYERELGKSAVEIIMGSLWHPNTVLRHHGGMPKWGRFGWAPATASFKDRLTGTWVNVQIDHILTSSTIQPEGVGYRTWDPFNLDKAGEFKKTLWTASDHYPVSLDIAE